MEYLPVSIAMATELMQPRVEITRRYRGEIDLVHRGRRQL